MPADHSRPYALLGAHLTSLRERLGISQTQLAARAGVSQPQLSRLEQGKTRLTPAVARLLAPTLGVSVAFLLALRNVQDMSELDSASIDKMLTKAGADLAQTERRQTLLRFAASIKATDADLVWLLRHYDKDRS